MSTILTDDDRQRVPDWRPIETAPKDATAILVMRDIWPGTKSGRAEECNGHNTYVAQWWEGEKNGAGAWICYMGAVCDPECPIEPTHWMPLPAPPSAPEVPAQAEQTKCVPCPTCGANTASPNPLNWCACPKQPAQTSAVDERAAFTVVYRNPTPEEVAQLIAHPKSVWIGWCHAAHERDEARATLAQKGAA